MNASNDHTAPKGLRGWWQSPPRSGMQRLISPWEYRHLRVFGLMRIAGGSIATGAGVICLAYNAYGWAAFFLALGAANSRAATGTSVSIARHLPEAPQRCCAGSTPCPETSAVTPRRTARGNSRSFPADRRSGTARRPPRRCGRRARRRPGPHGPDPRAGNGGAHWCLFRVVWLPEVLLEPVEDMGLAHRRSERLAMTARPLVCREGHDHLGTRQALV